MFFVFLFCLLDNNFGLTSQLSYQCFISSCIFFKFPNIHFYLVFHNMLSLFYGCRIFYYFPKDIIYWLVFFFSCSLPSGSFFFCFFVPSFHVGFVLNQMFLLIVCNMKDPDKCHLNIYVNCDLTNRKKMIKFKED